MSGDSSSSAGGLSTTKVYATFPIESDRSPIPTVVSFVGVVVKNSPANMSIDRLRPTSASQLWPTGRVVSTLAPTVECVTSLALELFSHGASYPSLIARGYTAIVRDHFAHLLTRDYRSPESIWGLSLNWESIGNYPWSGDKTVLALFDITTGYDRRLYDIIEQSYLSDNLNYILTANRVSFDAAIQAKNETPSYVTAPVFWMTSNCYPIFNRSGYMHEFMSHVPVNAWGNCGRNKGPELPEEIRKIQGSPSNVNHFQGNWVMAKKAFLKSYKFTIAIENSLTHDYVTEKLWNPLATGSVPLYYGAPNIDDWLPCQGCIIDLQKFPTPRAAGRVRQARVRECHSVCRVSQVATAARLAEVPEDHCLSSATEGLFSREQYVRHGA